MQRLLPIALAVVVMAALTLGACGSDDRPVTSGDEPGPVLEEPGDYRSVGVTENGEDRPLVDGTIIELRLSEGRLSANAGCNHLGGPYTVDAGVLAITGVSMTEMGCEQARMDQDEWFVDFLLAGPTVAAVDDGLELSTDTTTIRFIDRAIAEPDEDLVGTTWAVTGFIDGATASSPASGAQTDDEPATVRFEDNGFVTGFDGCNAFGHAEDGTPAGGTVDSGLRYEIDGDRITFTGERVQTLIGCEDDDDLERYNAVLSGTVTWEIEASNLTLRSDDGRGVAYQARA